MSEYNIENVNISGNSIHFGDKYIFKNYQKYLKTNPNLDEVEKEIAKKVFQLAENDAKRNSLLSFFETLRSEQKDKIQKQNPNLWKDFVQNLKESGLKKLADKTVAYTISKAPQLNELFINIGPSLPTQ